MIKYTKEYLKASKRMLDEIHLYAVRNSGCKKVAVGSAISFVPSPASAVAFGANVTVPYNCRTVGCLRVEKYGEDSKLHRNPEDCRALHSEINAICNAAKNRAQTEGKTIFVTRYPCEACARAIVAAGIKRVVYGRQQECSEETMKIFSCNKIDVLHIKDWDAPDVVY